MSRCITCGEECNDGKIYCNTRKCQCSSSIISDHLKIGRLLKFRTVREFFQKHKDLQPRKFKELLADNQNYLYSMYHYISWTEDIQEIRYCIEEGITSQPKCLCCDNNSTFQKTISDDKGTERRYRRYTDYCKLHKSYKAMSEFSIIRENKLQNQTIIPFEELLKRIESYKERNLDKIHTELIFNNLLGSIKYYTKFIDEIVNRKICTTERLICLLYGITELPLCEICGEYGVKYTRAIKRHMPWCSIECCRKISVLRNKTQEEMNKITIKRQDTIRRISKEKREEWVIKGNDTKRSNNTHLNILSKGSQELFWNIYNSVSDIDDMKFGELNNELHVKTVNGIKYVDFVYKNKVIEFYGDNVHGNPYKYRDYDRYNYYNTTEKLIGDKWSEDAIRIKGIISEGYDVLIVWSNEFYRNKEEILTKCLNFLNIS